MDIQPPHYTDDWSRIHSSLKNLAGGNILDVATAEGGFITFIKEKLSGLTDILGIDIIKPSSREAQEIFALSNIHFIQMDAKMLGFSDHSFDIVSLSASLHHFDDPPAVLQEINRVLKYDGTFIFAEMSADGPTDASQTMIYLHHWLADIDSAQDFQHNHTLAREEILNLICQAGFHQTTVFDLFDPDKDPFEEKSQIKLLDLIDRNLQRTDQEHLIQRGKILRKRLLETGNQMEPVLFIIVQKKKAI
jgi:SAM-dependent methyltransferase